jgi:hypothetical protein
VEQTPQQTGADHLRAATAAQRERLALPLTRENRHPQQVDGQVDDVAQVVARTDRRHCVVENLGQVVGAQAVRAAQTDVEIRVLGQRRRHDSAVDEGFDENVPRLVAEAVDRQIPNLAPAADEIVADEERGVGPRALGEVLDHCRDTLIALHQQDVALADAPLEALHVVVAAQLIGGEGLREKAGDALGQPVSKTHDSLSKRPARKSGPQNPFGDCAGIVRAETDRPVPQCRQQFVGISPRLNEVTELGGKAAKIS